MATPLFTETLKLSLNDAQRSHRLAGLSVMKGTPVYSVFESLFEKVMCEGQYDQNDITLAINCADAIYNLIGELPTEWKCE